jgi:hypothetical protein
MMYAVNVGDMTKDVIISSILIGPHVQGRQIVKAEKTLDGGAVVLECDDETAENIKAVIRMRYEKHAFRIYEGKGQTWKRV